MTHTLTQLSALLFSTAILITGNGLITALLPVRAELESFETLEIGILGAVYFGGFIVGCVYGPRLVRRVGHIRTFASLSSLTAATVLVFPLIPDAMVWWVLRFLQGCCFAGLYVVIESWLNDRTDIRNRGAVMSTYTFITFSFLTVGQYLLLAYPEEGFELFVIVAVLLGLSLIPVSLTTASMPRQPMVVRLDLPGLWRLSPVGFAGCLVIGCANGSFWALGPVYARRSGLEIGDLVYFLAGATLVGALTQWPVGRLSDKTDRRLVIIGTAICAAVSGVLLGSWPEPSANMLIILSAAFGGFAMPLYAVSVAHANDYAASDNFVTTASSLLVVYGCGATIGPLIASSLMDLTGPGGLFMFTTIVHSGLVIFAALRFRMRARPTEEERCDFVVITQTSPVCYENDPRSNVESDDVDKVE